MFDRDLAELYEVETKVFNQAVKRNRDRFPDDFMFQLNKKESDIFLRSQVASLEENTNLISQNVISSWGGTRKFPYVFTEQGVAMLSSVLKSNRAIEVNIQIIRTFTKMRRLLASNKELAAKIEKMERKYDANFKIIFKVLARFLKTDPKGSELKIAGFGEKE